MDKDYVDNEEDFKKISEGLMKLLKQKSKYYQEENQILEYKLKQLELLVEELCRDSLSSLEALTDYTEKLECEEPNPTLMSISYANKLRKQDNYVAKLKASVKAYVALNDKLEKEIKASKHVLKNSRNQCDNVLNVLNDELKILKSKVSKYEAEIVKFERKYPWLKNEQLDLKYISNIISCIEQLKKEKGKLIKELGEYQGLKPDIKEARDQFAEIKLEDEKLNKLLFGNYKNV